MNYYRTGAASVGSILLPESQEKRLDAMRKDTLDRIDKAAGRVSGAVVLTGAITAASTLALIHEALKHRRGA